MKNIIYTILFTISILFNFTACGSNKRTDNIKEQNYYTFNDTDTIYETGEDNSTDRWETWAGFDSYDHIQNVGFGANGSNRAIFFRKEWINEYTNISNFKLPLYNDYQFIVEFDHMKKEAENKHCFIIGIQMDTDWGTRYLSFSTFFDMKNMEPTTETYDNGITEMNFPLSMDYVNDGGVWKNLRFDLANYLHQFEADNNIIAITAFTFQGGDDYLDNIRLVSE